MRGSAKYGGVTLTAIRDRDSLSIRVGTASSYEVGREHAQLILRSSSVYRCIHIRNYAGKRIATIRKEKIGERQLG